MSDNSLPSAEAKTAATTVPGPPLRFFPRSDVKSLREHSLNYLQSLHEQHGDIVRLPAKMMHVYSVIEPELAGRILVGTEKSNKKGVAYKRLSRFLGQGLVTSMGKTWSQQRKLANPAFQPKALRGFFTTIDEECKKAVLDVEQQIKIDPVVDVSELCSRLALAIITRILFSMDITEKAGIFKKSLFDMEDYSNKLVYNTIDLPLYIPGQNRWKVKHALNELDAIVYPMIEEHRKHPERYQDLLSVYLQSRDENGKAMSDKQLRDEVITLIIAGHETTASSVAFTFELLAKNPAAGRQLLEEIQSQTEAPTFETLSKPTYTQQVFSEAIRLYPTVWNLGRSLLEDLNYKGYHFPRGSEFLIAPFLIHRLSRFWPDPEEFRPERFAPEGSKGRNPFAYMPFGAGPRVCIGAGLARLEAHLILNHLFGTFHMEPVPGTSYELLPRVTLVTHPGIKLRLSKR